MVRAELAPAEADEVIAASIRRMRARGVPGTWHVGPSMRPADLAGRWLRAGRTHGGSEPGMAADLHVLNEDLPGGLRIERVRDEEAANEAASRRDVERLTDQVAELTAEVRALRAERERAPIS